MPLSIRQKRIPAGSNTHVLWQDSGVMASTGPACPMALDVNFEVPGRGLGIPLQFGDDACGTERRSGDRVSAPLRAWRTESVSPTGR